MLKPRLQRRFLTGLLIAICLTSRGRAEDAGEDLYRLGMSLLTEGKTEQAIERFEQLVRSAPSSPYSDDALLAEAKAYYPVTDVEAFGIADPKKIARARDLLRTIRERYASSDSAGAASYSLGLIAMDPQNPSRDLDEAERMFSAAAELHPGSAESDLAALAAARCAAWAGRTDNALAGLLRFLEARPDARDADRARFLLADLFDRSGARERAIQELQALREELPSSPLSSASLDKLTLLYRARRLAAGPQGAVVWSLDESFRAGEETLGLQSPRSMATAADGSVWIGDEKADALIVVGSDGRQLARHPWQRPISVAIARDGSARAADSRSVGRPGEEPAAPAAGPEKPEGRTPRVRRIGGIAVDPEGRVLVVDDSESAIVRYRPGMSFDAILYKAPSGSLQGLAVGPEGNIWTGLPATREILLLDSSGRETRRIHGKGKGFSAISDLSVDAAGDLYVLDSRARAIQIFDRRGESIGSIDLGSNRLRVGSPLSLAVDSQGRILIADRRPLRVVRLR